MATIGLDGGWQHVGEEDPGLVEAHGRMRRHFGGAGLGLVALDNLGDQVAKAGRQGLRVEELRRHRVDVVDEVGVLAEGLRQLVDLAVTGGSEEHTSELQSLMRISYAVFCLKKKH